MVPLAELSTPTRTLSSEPDAPSNSNADSSHEALTTRKDVRGNFLPNVKGELKDNFNVPEEGFNDPKLLLLLSFDDNFVVVVDDDDDVDAVVSVAVEDDTFFLFVPVVPVSSFSSSKLPNKAPLVSYSFNAL